MTTVEIIRLQRAINAASYGPVAVDGRYGAKTRAAYAAMLAASPLGGVGVALPTPVAAKPWWTSRAVLGALATILAGLAGFAGVSLDSGQLAETLLALATAVSGAIALWGSVRRTAPIDSTLIAPGVRFGPDRLRPSEPLPTDPERGDAVGYWTTDRGPLGGPD